MAKFLFAVSGTHFEECVVNYVEDSILVGAQGDWTAGP